MSQGLVRDYLVKATGETEVFVNGTKAATTSGTSVDITGIPSGIKKFTVSFEGFTQSIADETIIQLGDSGGIETTGYLGTAWNSVPATTNVTAGLPCGRNVPASGIVHGNFTAVLHDAATNTWTWSGGLGRSDNNAIYSGSGSKALSGELTQIRLTTVGGTATFSAGSINIQYDNPDLAISGNGSVAAGVTDVFVNGVKQASTSGTEIDFTIPSGVKGVKISYVGCSTSGGSEPIIQLGDGTIKTTGYLGAGSNINTAGVSTTNKTAGFAIGDAWTGGRNWHGTTFLTLHEAATNTWVASSSIGRSDSTGGSIGSGSAALSGELTTVRITTENGTDTFDAGSINVQYDNPNLDLGSGVISGGVVQTVNVQDGTHKSGTGVIPVDNTIPQNTEGTEFFTASITPTDSANKLKIEVVIFLSNSLTNVHHTTALFQDSTVNAIAVGNFTMTTAQYKSCTKFTYWMTAGTTSSTTFKVRAGGSAASTTYMNGSNTAQFGGKLQSSITITEYKV